MTKPKTPKKTVFQKILDGEIAASKVYEDQFVLAFDDINPQYGVHVVIITKLPFKDLRDDISPFILGHLLKTADIVARLKNVREGGYRVVINTGKNAGQEVPHLHLHFLAGNLLAPIGISEYDVMVELPHLPGHKVPMCGLCGNSGIIDTRGHCPAPGRNDSVDCGVRAFCLCPNGRTMKVKGYDLNKDYP